MSQKDIGKPSHLPQMLGKSYVCVLNPVGEMPKKAIKLTKDPDGEWRPKEKKEAGRRP